MTLLYVLIRITSCFWKKWNIALIFDGYFTMTHDIGHTLFNTHTFSVAKVTLHSQMSVRLLVCQSVTETPQQLQSFIFHHSTWPPSSFIILQHSSTSFILRLLSFSACFNLSKFWPLKIQTSFAPNGRLREGLS